MSTIYVGWDDGTYLYHHGIKGMHWGERRFQNEDGSLTEEGRKHYGVGLFNKANPNYSVNQRRQDKKDFSSGAVRRINKAMNKGRTLADARNAEKNRLALNQKAAKITGAIGSVAGLAGGAALGAKLVNKYLGGSGINGSGPISTMANAQLFALSAAGVIASAKVGKVLGKIGGESITMLSAGYAPGKAKKKK